MSERKIVEYRLVSGGGGLDLEDAVTKLLKYGYHPYGSPFIDSFGSETQAMVRYEDE
jgi:hypothetical protein